MKPILKKIFKLVQIAIVAGATLYAVNAFAAGTSGASVSTIASNVQTGLKGVANILEDVALVAGVGFILVAFFKFHQHKQQPTQVPLSQGLALLVIGAGLTLFPHLLQTPGQFIGGASMTPAKMSSDAVSKLIS